MAGKLRLSVLHVLKLRHGGDNGWRNNYFIFAENRPLLALHQVLHDKMVVVTNEQLCCNSIKNMCAVRQATSVVQVALDEKKKAMLTNLITLQMKAAGLLAQDQFRSQFQLYQRCLFLMSLFPHFLINIYWNELFSLYMYKINTYGIEQYFFLLQQSCHKEMFGVPLTSLVSFDRKKTAKIIVASSYLLIFSTYMYMLCSIQSVTYVYINCTCTFHCLGVRVQA